ncbi:DNA repair protein RadC [Clostridium carboxidivorans P7]|uniref:DNA repair protein RadC n=1 Tax=Clostridium carboxidivorans P7 TaxID=536227 RepID=C6Q027_9CLOT|nr:DNA repair protein RadC [Clostridium carboxidivorans]AKN32285.1 DNA repair protein RadC [Clostridium carboxidivorans P7]EET85168.1 DNA repair protein RadC [Clostridium carboxidivorans P7]
MEQTLKIMDLPENERPRERLLRYGTQSLSNAELLAIILSSGTKKENVLSLSNRIIKETGGLNGLLKSTAEDFMSLSGIGEAKAAQLMALLEISKRFKSYRDGNDYKVSKPRDAAALVMDEMKNFKQEHLKVIMLNTKNVVLFIKDVSVGSLNSSIVHPREVFCDAIRKNSAFIIVCHNHPSGDPQPSNEDINVTNRLKECGKLLGIELLDHLIIGNGRYISLKEKGIL